LWSNHQNHHPACISFDFPDGNAEESEEQDRLKSWRPLLDEVKGPKAEKIEYLCFSVAISPPLPSFVIDDLRDALLAEMQENLRLYRFKLGFDTIMDNRPALINYLKSYLDIHEAWLSLDPDLAPPEIMQMDQKNADDTTKFIREKLEYEVWNDRGTAFNDNMRWKNYRKSQEERWKKLQKDIEKFTKNLDNFPTRKGKKFVGIPVHFCTSQTPDIRTYLMEVKVYQELINLKFTEVIYTVHVEMYPLLGQVQSVWLYIGVQVDLSDKLESFPDAVEGEEEE
jgi:hypothetical protein